MKRTKTRLKFGQAGLIALIACLVLLSCGLTALAADDFRLDIEQPPYPPTVTAPIQFFQEERTKELYPNDVQIIIENGTRQIVKRYVLTAQQNPADIPRDSFDRDGWRYTMTDITEKRTSGVDSRSHIETVEVNTDTQALNDIVMLLASTMYYESDDGYCGTLTLDLTSVKCETAGYRRSSYTVSATREYPHLSNADTSLIPKTITDNGRTLTLDSVSWEVQHYTTVDYEDIPDSYRAVATYTANVSTSLVTGYITTADYIGEVSRMVMGDTVYTVYFSGNLIPPEPKPVEPPPVTVTPVAEPEASPPPASETKAGWFSVVDLLCCLGAVAGIFACAYIYLYKLRHNVKVYRITDERRLLVAKDRISAKRLRIDLTPLEGNHFAIVIDKPTAKSLNGKTIELVSGATVIKHMIAFEGNAYNIEADFSDGCVNVIY